MNSLKQLKDATVEQKKQKLQRVKKVKKEFNSFFLKEVSKHKPVNGIKFLMGV